MKDHPILMTGDMVRAILEDRKKQTRRIIKPQPKQNEGVVIVNNSTVCIGAPGLVDSAYPEDHADKVIYCPYKPGDRLWVRETFYHLQGNWEEQYTGHRFGEATFAGGGWDRFIPLDCIDFNKSDGSSVNSEEIIKYVADGECEPFDGDTDEEWFKWEKRPPIHMPKWACRLWLEVTAVRAERVQEISEDDCMAEGIIGYGCNSGIGGHMHHDTTYPAFPEKGGGFNTAAEAFEVLWDSINAKRGYGWESNPFVWVIEFKRIEQ